MTDLQQYTGLLDVRTGELLEPTLPNIARVIESARAMKANVNEIVAEATRAAVEISELRGTKTLHGDGETITVSGGAGMDYDPSDLIDALLEAGCPQDRIDAAVVAQVTYKVDRSVLRQLAGANENYAAAIELAEREVERPYRVSVKLRRNTDDS